MDASTSLKFTGLPKPFMERCFLTVLERLCKKKCPEIGKAVESCQYFRSGDYAIVQFSSSQQAKVVLDSQSVIFMQKTVIPHTIESKNGCGEDTPIEKEERISLGGNVHNPVTPNKVGTDVYDADTFLDSEMDYSGSDGGHETNSSNMHTPTSSVEKVNAETDDWGASPPAKKFDMRSTPHKSAFKSNEPRKTRREVQKYFNDM